MNKIDQHSVLKTRVKTLGLRIAVRSLLTDNIQGWLDSFMFSIEAHYIADAQATFRHKS